MKRLNINLKDELFWKFKRRCLDERISMTDKLTKFISYSTKLHDAFQNKEKLDGEKIGEVATTPNVERDKIVGEQLSKPNSKPSEQDYEDFVKHYEGYWKKKYDKALLEIIEDLYHILDLWCKPLDPNEMKEFRTNLDETIEKWEKKPDDE